MFKRLILEMAVRFLNQLGPERTARVLRRVNSKHPFFVDEMTKKMYAESESSIPDAVLINALRARSDVQSTPFYAYHVFSEMHSAAVRAGASTNRVLELGPGSSIGTLICWLACCAEFAAGADIEPFHGDRTQFYDDLGRYLAVVSGWKWWRNYGQSGPIIQYPNTWETVDVSALADEVDYRAPVHSHDLPWGDESFDIVCSCAVLEHVDNPDGTVAEMSRVLAPGGVAAHEIDLRYHYAKDGSEQLKFLEWTEEEYIKRTQLYGGGHGIDSLLHNSWAESEAYCNRLRISDWLPLFENHGFNILVVEPLAVIDKSIIAASQFEKPYCHKSADDLAVTQVRIVAKKSKA